MLYTNPIITPGTSVLATDDNINDYYAKWDYPDISDSLKRVFAKEADELRAHQGTIYELWKPDTFKLKTILPYPKRISILMNENCASSTELFLLKTRQSSKVTLYGKHTMGAVDYTNASTADLSCKLFKLRYSTSRSNTALTQPIDNIGIRPDLMIRDDVKDWIQFVRGRKP